MTERTRTHPLLTQKEGAQELVRAIQAALPYAAGKLGTSEFEALCWYIAHRRRKSYDTLSPYPQHVFRHMVMNAGLFPTRPDTLDQWAEHMLQNVLPVMDLMVEWNPSSKLHEYYFLEAHAPHSKRTVLRALEPYYESDPSDRYTLFIPEGAKIAIISPFADTILEQSSKLPAIWESNPVWSTGSTAHTFIPIQTFYSPLVAGDRHQWAPRIHDWHAACDEIVEKVKQVGAKYAFIGCGALSLPIAAALKQAGCIAIHTGGATQILFGIKGRRWDSHAIISKLYNAAWTRPAAHEIPERSVAIENGCYF
jgi:hypothetical protein